MCNIPKLQNDFNFILHLRTELQTKRDTLEEKLDEIKAQYNDLVKQNSKKIYLYCLDSMYFQYKILRVELEQFQKTIALIFNRMYGDYYKLYNIIHSQCRENCTNIKMSSENVVVYKDLDPFTEFSTDDLIVTHRIIVDTLGKLQELYSTKQEEINDHNANMRVGFSVSSFISTLSYENKILGEHISLYSNYLSFYHSSQRKYLDNVLGKITNFMREIEEDILTNHKSYKKETITIVESIVEEEVKDEVKEEEVKQEEVKQEEVKEEEFKNEEVKNEEVKNEEVKVQSEVKNEEVKTEEVKTDEEPDEINSVLINRDDGFQTVGRGGKNGKSKRR